MPGTTAHQRERKGCPAHNEGGRAPARDEGGREREWMEGCRVRLREK
jgi:hypothetical protein